MKLWGFLVLLICCSSWAEEELDCDKAWTTLEINQCMYKDFLAAEKVMERYLAESIKRYIDDDVSVSSIESGQKVWIKYREEHCGAVYDVWRTGTVRTAMALGCKLDLTHQRTRELWEAFLTYVDSTPPLLPEPAPYAPESY